MTYHAEFEGALKVATNQYIAGVFPEPTLTASRRQKIIGEYLIMRKIPKPVSRSKRYIKGMTKYNKPCNHALL